MTEDLPKQLRIVIGAHTPHGTPYVVGSHHLAREFVKMGHQVFHIPIPLGPQDLFVADHINFRKLRWAGWRSGQRKSPPRNDIFLLTFFPWELVRRVGFQVAEKLGFGASMVPGVKSLLSSDILIVDHPKQFWLVDAIKPKLLLYRPTDAYSYPGHKDDKLYRQIESWILRRSDGAVLTATETLSRMHSLCHDFPSPPMRVLENGVDLSGFENASTATPIALNDLPHPRLLYIGSFDNRIDYDFIIDAARALPRHTFILGGPMTALQKALFTKYHNIVLIGEIAYRDLAQYMNSCDVGFMPLNDHPFNATRSPMKLYEFAACGLPMVARSTPELTRRSLPFCFMYEDLSGFSNAIDKAVDYKKSAANEMRILVQEKSWHGIAADVLAFCREIRSGSKLSG